MKSLKLRTKLIGINCALLFVILASQYLFQNIFLEKNYKNYKKEQMINSLEQYENQNKNSKMIEKYQKELSETQNITIFEMDKKFDKTIGSTIESDYVVIKDKNGKETKVQVFWGEEYFEDIKIGDEIIAQTIQSKIEETPIVIETVIKRNGKIILQMKEVEIVSNIETSNEIPTDLEIESKKIQGTLTDFKNSKDEINNHYQIIRYYTGTKEINIENQKLEYITYGGEPYLIGIQASEQGYIVAITSIKISKDTVAMFNQFNKYIILFGVILLGGLVILYEKLITKPVITINSVSKEISKQNFDIKLAIKTGDELEELAETVNSLSKNLDQKIQELKVAYNQLGDEYQERIQIEKNQKFLLMNISHDLKTPLTVIKGNLQAIKDGIYDVDTCIKPTLDVVDEISQTLNEMLELTKLQNTQLTLNLQPCDLSRIVYQTYDRIKSLVKEKNIEIHFEMESDAFVNIDQQEMKKVIENLIINGIKYSPDKEHIYIQLEEQTNKYIWSIENTGVHVDEMEVESLFKEFYRCDKSRNQINRGNGLGLAIVKTILEAHKLIYHFENTEKGMKFTIELPKI